MLGYHPQDQAGTPPDQVGPLGPGTPPPTRQAPPPRDQAGTAPSPPEMSILGDTVNERAVCILLECNLVDMSDDLAT